MKNGNIQELEIYKTQKYSKDLRDCLNDFMCAKSNEFLNVKKVTEDTLNQEQEDIELLNKKKEKSLLNIKINEEKINCALEKIKSNESSILEYEEEIENLPVPVYYSYYDSHGHRCIEINDEKTKKNRTRINTLNILINLCKKENNQLKQEIQKRKDNLLHLEKMIDEIKKIMNEKQEHIKRLKEDLNAFTEKYKALKKITYDSTNVLQTLEKQLFYAEECVRNFGQNIKKTYYGSELRNEYKQDMTFSVTSKDVAQQINILKEYLKIENSLQQRMVFNRNHFAENNADKTTTYALKVNDNALQNLQAINKNIEDNINFLVKANEYLERYENIIFRRNS